MWQFTEAIDGLTEACTALETPITGGNVSFYNETLGNPIYPTPIIGILGLMEDAESTVASAFRVAGDAIVLLDGGPAADANVQETVNAFSSSEYAKEIHGIVRGSTSSDRSERGEAADRMHGEIGGGESHYLSA